MSLVTQSETKLCGLCNLEKPAKGFQVNAAVIVVALLNESTTQAILRLPNVGEILYVSGTQVTQSYRMSATVRLT